MELVIGSLKQLGLLPGPLRPGVGEHDEPLGLVVEEVLGQMAASLVVGLRLDCQLGRAAKQARLELRVRKDSGLADELWARLGLFRLTGEQPVMIEGEGGREADRSQDDQTRQLGGAVGPRTPRGSELRTVRAAGCRARLPGRAARRSL